MKRRIDARSRQRHHRKVLRTFRKEPDVTSLAPGEQSRRSRRLRKQSLAKTGLIAALGTLTVTALVHGKASRGLHIAAGIALLGLSAWHHSLYPKKRGKADISGDAIVSYRNGTNILISHHAGKS